jgi:hypothetical protein
MFAETLAKVTKMTSGHRSRQEEEEVEEEDVDMATPPPHTERPIPVSDKLTHFRTLIGIHSAPTFTAISILKRPAPNVGIYARTVHAESRARLEFRIFTVLANGCLGLQIIVAASLTALGAANGSHGVITAFGAVNTIIAGFLTFLKGSGLPNRLKYYQNEWSMVREYIEQRERDFGLEGCVMDVEEVVRRVEMMYEDVREDVKANTPDGYVSMSQSRKTRGVALQPAITAPAAARLRDGEKSSALAIAAAEKSAEARIFGSSSSPVIAKSTVARHEDEEIPVHTDTSMEDPRHRSWKGAMSLV